LELAVIAEVAKQQAVGRRLSMRRREALSGVIFVAPQVLGFGAFVAGPIVAVLWFSLYDWNIIRGTLDFVGLDNYGRLIATEEVAHVARITLLFGAGFVPLTVIGGLAIALAVNRRTRLSMLLRSFYFLPVVISLAAWALVWQLMLQPKGPINGALELALNAPAVSWLRDPTIALIALIAAQILKALGYSMVLFLAALQTVPNDLREAARVDGADDRGVFRSITLPLIAPFTFMVTILLTISSFKSFALIFLMTGGGPGLSTTIMSLYIYRQGLQLFEMGYASALAVVLFAAVLVLTVLQFLIRRRWVFDGE
jgi:multiple sugar transport system permease protein